MCRFVAYKGLPISVDELLFRPDHSLVKQSYEAREIPEPLNGDGFGLGWYTPELDTEPAVFASVTPAWNNQNLRYLAPKLVSPVIMAHVRAARSGDAAEANCHPFHYGDMLMMHNGWVAGFSDIKRTLMQGLSNARFNWIRGSTDSEHLFALFLDHYLDADADARGADAMADAIAVTFRDLAAIQRDAGITAASHLNLVVSDGREMAACRYVDDADQTPRSLHHTEGSRYVCDQEACAMRKVDSDEQAVLIASEPLTNEAEHWHDVPANHVIMVDKHAQPTFREL